MKNIGYLQCQRGGYHSGEFLNIVCCENGCKDNLLCCCACIQEMHQNHKTKTLKKLILDADSLTKNFKEPLKVQKKQQKITLNTDIMANMVENEQKTIIFQLHQLKQKFLQEIDNLQSGIQTYYKSLYQTIHNPHQSASKDYKTELAKSMQLVQGSGSVQTLKTNVLSLMKNLQIFQKVGGESQGVFDQPDEESYFNFLKNSSDDINNIVNIKIKDLCQRLNKQSLKMKSINSKISSFWSTNLYKFSDQMKHSDITLINPFTIRANSDAVYQLALMNPPLTFSNEVETFTFKINANDLEWVAVGVSYKNIAQKNNFNFNFNDDGHGCYLISGNAGTWSHSDPDFNNQVKAFSFKQGDSITCTVTKTKICFFKNVPPELEDNIAFNQQQYYELQIKPQSNDTLHPCVICFYMNTEVEYLPSFKNLQLQMPVHHYKFSKQSSHHSTIIINDTHLHGCNPTAYKCCVLDKPIENGPGNQFKSVTFRIVKSPSSWVGLGFCHKNIVKSKNYDFPFEGVGHGCYMISANGGSWSHIDPDQNNLVKTFKFIQGDLITVSLDEENQTINFSKGIQKYKLSYQPIQGDKLYPVVVLYYADDEIQVLPQL